MTEGYQYSQLSPSRSPSGPTYTQLSSGARTPATQQYHAVTTVPNNPGKFPDALLMPCFFSLFCSSVNTRTLRCVVQVCGAGRANSIRHHSPMDRPVLKWPRRRNHRIPGRPDLARSHRNCLICCRCCRIRVARPGSRNSTCSQLPSSSNGTNDTLESSFHAKGIHRFPQLFVICSLPLEVSPELLERVCVPYFY